MSKFRHAVTPILFSAFRNLIPSLIFPITAFLFPLSVSAQLFWESADGPEGGATWDFWHNDEYAFYPDQYNFFRTSDGLNWEKIPINNLWPIATSGSKVAALQGFGFNYRLAPDSLHFQVSNDNGATWLEGGLPPTLYSGAFTSIAIADSTIFVPDPYAGLIFKTDDDGLTWDTIAPPGQYCYDLWSFEGKLYAAWSDKFWRWNATDLNWSLVSPAFDAQDSPITMFVSGQILLFATEYHLWGSNDGGVTWKKTSMPYNSDPNRFVQIGSRIYKQAGTTDLAFTENGGQTWTSVPLSTDYDALEIGKAGGFLLASTYNKGIFRLNEATNQLVPSNHGLLSASVYDLEADSAKLWAACGNGVFAFDIPAQTWTQMPLPLTEDYYNVIVANGNGKVAVSEEYRQKVSISNDGGVTWSSVAPFTAAGFWPINIFGLYWLGDNLFAYDDSYKFCVRSTDGGTTWVNSGNFFDPVYFNGKFYGKQFLGGLSFTTDLGITWQEDSNCPFSGVIKVYATDDRLFVWTNEQNGAHLYYSEDGITWKYANDGLPDFLVWDTFQFIENGRIWHKNDKYYLFEEVFGFYISLDSCKTWLKLDYRDKINCVDSTFYKGGFRGGVAKTGIPDVLGLSASGNVFKDDNDNGIKDPDEISIPAVKVNVKGDELWPYWFTITDNEGDFHISANSGGVNSISPVVNSSYVDHVNPPAYVLNAPASNYNFGIHFKENIADGALSGSFITKARPGVQLDFQLAIENTGTLPLTGKAGLKLPSGFAFISAEPQPTTIVSPDSLVWDFSQLGLFEKRTVKISGMVSASAPVGLYLDFWGSLYCNEPETNFNDNYFHLSGEVVDSNSANEKLVEPEIGLSTAEILQGKNLTYTILFQNTDTLQVNSVRITDQLDAELDPETLKLISSSHPVSQFHLLPGGLLEIIFDNIQLPAGNLDESASHGFVKFSVQRRKLFRPDFEILNKASIFFDANNPVITNTVKTKLFNPVVADKEPPVTSLQPQLKISPNPASDFCRVDSGKFLTGYAELQVTDISGKVCLRQTVSEISNVINLPLYNLNNGSYTVIATNKAGSLSGKLLVSGKK